MKKQTISARVYYEDTDSGGVVYYANYLKYAERARTETLRALGFENTALAAEDGIFIVVRHAAIDYRAPARLDDLLEIETTLIDLANASFTMHQSIRRADVVLVDLKVRLAIIDTQGKPCRIPLRLKKVLEGLL